jgi:PhnB protein
MTEHALQRCARKAFDERRRPTRQSKGACVNAHTITPHVVVRDAAKAVDWYTNVLGAEERLRIPVPDGRLMSVELRFGDSAVMLADEFPDMGIVSPQTLGGTYMALHLLVADVDTVWQRALDAGAEVFRPLQDSFWGERSGQVIDPFGHRWGLAQHLRDVSPEELLRAAQEMFAQR